jgi:KDO2-lipid IV(A) lauroyltransferase
LREQRKQKRFTQPLEWWLSWRFLQGLVLLLRGIPFRHLHRLGNLLGTLAYYGMPRYRRVAHRNLRLAFGDAWSEAELGQVARASFRHLGINLVEFLWLPRLTERRLGRLVEVPQRHYLDEALARGNGVIIISAHYGNWEFMPAWLVQAGYRLSTIVRDADHGGLNQLILDFRRSLGQEILLRRTAARPALACLRRNELLGIMLDQNTLHGGVFVDFFGHPAATAPGAATFAIRTGAALLPLFCVRQPDRSFEFVIEAPLYADPTQPSETEIPRLTQELTHRIEAQIRSCPEQWMWIHNRWKLRPDGSKVR